MSPALHPQIERFASETCDELSPDMAGFIAGVHKDSIRRLCARGVIEHSALGGARGYRNERYTITKAALLSYLIKTTQGPRDVILAAIAQRCPQWSEFASLIASGLPLQSAEARQPKAASKAAGTPSNIIALKEHPEFAFAAALNPPAAKAS